MKLTFNKMEETYSSTFIPASNADTMSVYSNIGPIVIPWAGSESGILLNWNL